MDRRGTLVIAILLVLALAAAIWAYMDYRSAPQVQAPPDTSRSEADAALLANLKSDWPRLEQGPLKHTAESGHWFLDAVEFIGPLQVLAHFEDGLNDEYALLNQLEGGTFQVLLRFQEPGQFQNLRAASSYSSTIYRYDPDKGTFTLDPSYRVFEPTAAAATMEVKIAWLNPEANLPNEVKPGDISGCDHVVLMERMVPKTSTPLTAALNELLKDKTHNIPPGSDGLYNYLANGDLKLESVKIEGKVAQIRLTGTPPPINGVCDEPRLRIQVEQTARQFPTVEAVFIWVNGVFRSDVPDPDMAP